MSFETVLKSNVGQLVSVVGTNCRSWIPTLTNYSSTEYFSVSLLLHNSFRWCKPRNRSLSAQPISIPKAQSRKKNRYLSAPREFLINCTSAMFDNHIILLFRLWNEQTFHTFSLRDLSFVLCSLDLDALRVQRIIGFECAVITQKAKYIIAFKARDDLEMSWGV